VKYSFVRKQSNIEEFEFMCLLISDLDLEI